MRIFFHGTPSERISLLRNLAECFAISSHVVEVRDFKSLFGAMEEGIRTGDIGSIWDLASLKELSDEVGLDEIRNFLLNHKAFVLLLASNTDPFTNEILRTLTGGKVHGVEQKKEWENVGFPAAGRAWSQELAGHAYQGNHAEGLALGTVSDTDSIMRLDQSSAFLQVPLGKSQIFVWSTARILDVLRPISAELDIERTTDQYVPLIIFLRAAFGDQCWHNPDASAAIVIDDPLLTRNYGSIRFPYLLESARRLGYHITLAFIPWNSWRSTERATQLFRDYQDCFSICVHGCDHTDNEYGSRDYDFLLNKNGIAIQRMERHRRKTGIPFEALMVCPQEKYSVEAVQALSDSGEFLALLNTRCIPQGLDNSNVRPADLFAPAQDSFFGFPIFKRHYWKEMAPFAMDLFLGRPAILVEHHDFFRNGCTGVEDFVSGLATLNPRMSWKPFSEIATQTRLEAGLTDKQRSIRFFTKTFQFRHERMEPVTYQLSKRLPETVDIQGVVVNGRAVPFSRGSDGVMLEIHASGPQSFEVRIESAVAKPTKAYSSPIGYRTKVAVRRLLSEARDKFTSKTRFAAKLERALKRSL